MHKKKKLLVLGLISVLALGTVGCSSDKDDIDEPIEKEQEVEKIEDLTNEEAIVGKWEDEFNNLEFTEDGVMKQESSVSGPQEVEIEAAEGVKVEVENANEDGIVEVEVNAEMSIEMEYEIESEDTMHLIFMGEKMEYNYKIEDDKLTIEEFGEFTRVK